VSEIELNDEQRTMLAGEQGLARQMGLRLVLDLASMAGATRLVPIGGAHLSGVSPLTGGLGLRLFLARLAADPGPGVAAPTTLNSAGCDERQFDAMRIAEPHFLDHHREIIDLYARLGVRTIQSCVPYEWEGIVAAQSGAPVAWAESNAICFANSYCGLRTNRESGLSALACALTGYAPDYGLLDEAARQPNLAVSVTTPLDDPTDFSVLGDWIGKQRRPGWRMPYGPIPVIGGLPEELSHEQRKALSAAAANYGCPLLYTAEPAAGGDYQDRLTFGPAELARRYEELRPRGPVSLVVLGCPQASLGELAAIARLLRGRRVSADPAAPGGPPPLWVFTSAAAKAIAERNGLADAIRDSGALLLENTCPEVVPYDQTWVRAVLTNSMKAEHYIKSGLNGIATAVMRLADCIAVAAGELTLEEVAAAEDPLPNPPPKGEGALPPALQGRVMAEDPLPGPPPNGEGALPPALQGRAVMEESGVSFAGRGLLSQGDFTVEGEALVTDTPITFLGYVNRLTGVIEEDDHPANGQSLAGKIAIFPRGTGSSVAPYVLLELHYRGVGPLAVVNSEIDQQTVPACSLEGIPYAYGFDGDVTRGLRSGDRVRLARRGDGVTLELLERGPRG
jgi:predicted aconitase/predicted aconitase with swiveling domain